MSNIVPVAATIYWPFMSRVNDMSGKYQVDLAQLSDKAVEALEMAGLSVANKGDDRGNYITVKSTYPIEPDFKGDKVDAGLIGNGTKATVAVGSYDWEFRGKKGRSPSIKKMLITEVVTYADGETEEFDLSTAL
jgi:hypothetical protein